jgi:hypothetical protein
LTSPSSADRLTLRKDKDNSNLRHLTLSDGDHQTFEDVTLENAVPGGFLAITYKAGGFLVLCDRSPS